MGVSAAMVLLIVATVAGPGYMLLSPRGGGACELLKEKAQQKYGGGAADAMLSFVDAGCAEGAELCRWLRQAAHVGSRDAQERLGMLLEGGGAGE